MESPWSTPTQSEIGEAEAALNAKGANDYFDGLDSDPASNLIRELGDGEPSFDSNVDDFMASNNNHDEDDLSQRSSSRAAGPKKGPKKSPRGASKSPEKRTSRSPTKVSRKLKKQTLAGEQKLNWTKLSTIETSKASFVNSHFKAKSFLCSRALHRARKVHKMNNLIIVQNDTFEFFCDENSSIPKN